MTEVGHLVHHEEEVMGTIVTIDLYGDSTVLTTTRWTPLVESACRVLHEADEVFSTWRVDSVLSRVRRGELAAGTQPVMVEVLGSCEEARALSSGWFDPWAMPGGVDPSGYVKGWAAQQALSQIVAPGVHGAIVNAAGDVAAFGAPAQGKQFRVGVVDPFDRTRLACVVALDASLATSGTYERGAHLVDPRSGEPAAAVASASVSGPDLGLADSLATAITVSGSPELVQAVNGYEAFVIDQDGGRRATRGFPFALPVGAVAAVSH